MITQKPWGSFEILMESHKYKVKRLIIKPEQSLSLQLHRHRSEHWVVVAGIAHVILDDKHKVLKQNQSIHIPETSKHRLHNCGHEDVIIIEVQCGDYLGEDDIERFQDQYGRAGG